MQLYNAYQHPLWNCSIGLSIDARFQVIKILFEYSTKTNFFIRKIIKKTIYASYICIKLKKNMAVLVYEEK